MFVKFLEMKDQEYEKQDYYLAQIAACIERAFSKRRVSIKDKLLKFVKGQPEKKISMKEAAAASKRKWFAALGLKKDGSKS